jgi:hypothetical protein
MRKCTSVQNFFPSHTAGKWSPKTAAQLLLFTSCASHWSQTVPLLVDGEFRKDNWEHLLMCPTIACIHPADSVQKRKLDCHGNIAKRHQGCPTPQGAIYVPMTENSTSRGVFSAPFPSHATRMSHRLNRTKSVYLVKKALRTVSIRAQPAAPSSGKNCTTFS